MMKVGIQMKIGLVLVKKYKDGVVDDSDGC